MSAHATEPSPDAVSEIYGLWKVHWDHSGFTIEEVGYFDFRRVVLPLTVVSSVNGYVGFAILMMEPIFAMVILNGATLESLERFRRRLSAETLGSVGDSALVCRSCALEADANVAIGGSGRCVGCRKYICSNQDCLGRLPEEAGTETSLRCKHCGEITSLLEM